MSQKPETQKTPKGKEIPVPEREEFMDDLRRVSKADEPKPKDSDANDTEKHR